METKAQGFQVKMFKSKISVKVTKSKRDLVKFGSKSSGLPSKKFEFKLCVKMTKSKQDL